MMGVANWLTGEEVELLYLDKANLHFKRDERGEHSLKLVEVACQNNLGLIQGVDMRERNLPALPGK